MAANASASLTDDQNALLLQTLQNIERHLAIIARTAEERTRLAAQTAARP